MDALWIWERLPIQLRTAFFRGKEPLLNRYLRRRKYTWPRLGRILCIHYRSKAAGWQMDKKKLELRSYHGSVWTLPPSCPYLHFIDQITTSPQGQGECLFFPSTLWFLKPQHYGNQSRNWWLSWLWHHKWGECVNLPESESVVSLPPHCFSKDPIRPLML